MANNQNSPQPITVTNQAQPVTSPNTANAPLGSAARVVFGRTPGIPSAPTAITPVRRK